MYVSFDTMPDNARIWIYQSSRKFSDSEKSLIDKKCSSFLHQWISHGKDLKSSYTIAYDQFLIISLDESYNQTSGCSIDNQVRFIKEIESELNVQLLEKSLIAFLISNEVKIYALHELKNLVEQGTILPDTLYFNSLITRKSDFENQWLVPAKSIWINRYFKSKSVT